MSESEFAAAAAFVSAGKGLSLSDEQRLSFYALYSQVHAWCVSGKPSDIAQATKGKCNTKKPWAIDFVASAKWFAFLRCFSQLIDGYPQDGMECSWKHGAG